MLPMRASTPVPGPSPFPSPRQAPAVVSASRGSIWGLLALVLATALGAGMAAAAPTGLPHHHLILVEGAGLDPQALAAAGYDVVGARPGRAVEIVATPEDQDRLRLAGYTLHVLQADLESVYAARAKGAGFGAFHTYSETVQALDDLHAAYPAVVSARFSLGTSHLGNTIWAVRVSDNPSVDEDEPEVLFDALHHAREVITVETVLELIQYLAESYDIDPDIRRLVDEREIYCVPIVNPDGCVFNEANYPSGGGMWRKNRRNNGDGSYGVDLNRNYSYQWSGSGSSSTPSSDTYRGPSAGSEPEVQALVALHAAHAFQTSQSFHSFSGLTLIPWGYTTAPCPDDAMLRDIAGEMVADNGYHAGSAPELLYVVNGSATDWAYGETGVKPKEFAFSNEIGDGFDGFWPSEARLPELVRENLGPALHLIDIAGVTLLVRGAVAIAGGDENGRLDPGESAGLSFTVQQGAVNLTASGVTLTVRSDDPYLTFSDPQRALGTLGPRATWSCAGAPLPVAVDAACPNGHLAEIELAFAWSGGACARAALLPVGPAATLCEDDFEGGTGAWTLAGTWGLSTASSHSTSHSLTESPSGSYANTTEIAARLTQTLDLSQVDEPVLRFWTRYDTEDLYDYGYVEASRDGTTWQRLAMMTGAQTEWQARQVSLASFVGESAVSLRLRFRSDTYYTADGWYVDDLAVTGYPWTNRPPTAPVASAPAEGGVVSGAITLVVVNAGDADGPGARTYGFRVYGDALCTQLLASQDGVAEGGSVTSWTIPPGALAAKAQSTYYWRAYADDGLERSPLSQVASFVTDPASGVAAGQAAAFLTTAPGGGPDAVRFRFAARRPGLATLTIYSLRGERVATPFRGEVLGEASAVWDQRDARGARVPSGVYLARLLGPDTDLSVKLAIVR